MQSEDVHPDNSRVILGFFYIQDHQLRFTDQEKPPNRIGTYVQEGEDRKVYLVEPWEEVTGERALELFPDLEPILKFVPDGLLWTDKDKNIFGKPV